MTDDSSDNSNWIIPSANFAQDNIDIRVSAASVEHRAFLKSALNYLYGSTKTLDRERLLAAEQYLTPSECLIIRWLHTRTNGSERKNYGPECIVAAKSAHYRCNKCNHPDVRVLTLDHINGRGVDVVKAFECLCANCHMIKSRLHNWTGKKKGA